MEHVSSIRTSMLVLAAALACATSAWANYEAGRRACDAGRSDLALALWRTAANAGNHRAMLSLGWLYLQGHGIQQDVPEAYRWFTLARRRDVSASLAQSLLDGHLTPNQKAKAREWARLWRPNVDRTASAQDTTIATELAASLTSDLGLPPSQAVGAVRSRDVPGLKAALADESNVNARDCWDRTAL